MTPVQIKLALEAGFLLLVIASSMWLGYHFTREHYEKLILQTEAQLEQAATDARQKQLNMQLSAEDQHAKDQLLVNQRDNLIDSLRFPPKITCRRDPAPNQSINGAGWVAATGTTTYIGIIEADRDKIISTYRRCAQLNIDVIELNNSF